MRLFAHLILALTLLTTACQNRDHKDSNGTAHPGGSDRARETARETATDAIKAPGPDISGGGGDLFQPDEIRIKQIIKEELVSGQRIKDLIHSTHFFLKTYYPGKRRVVYISAFEKQILAQYPLGRLTDLSQYLEQKNQTTQNSKAPSDSELSFIPISDLLEVTTVNYGNCDNSHDASIKYTNEKVTLCFDINALKNKTTEFSVRNEVRALIAHEYAHVYGHDEAFADIIQFLVLDALTNPYTPEKLKVSQFRAELGGIIKRLEIYLEHPAAIHCVIIVTTKLESMHIMPALFTVKNEKDFLEMGTPFHHLHLKRSIWQIMQDKISRGDHDRLYEYVSQLVPSLKEYYEHLKPHDLRRFGFNIDNQEEPTRNIEEDPLCQPDLL